MWRLTPQDNYEYEKLKRVLPFSLAIILASVSLPVTALADSAKVVTLGANLSGEQKASMYKYFGTSADQVDTIEVTNTDEENIWKESRRIPDWYKNI